jgi:transcriptional pleiotropic regulator of transition state genes
MRYSIGMARRIDPLGRIVIPKELREKFSIPAGTPLQMDIDGDCLVLKVYKPECIFCKSTEDVIEYNNKNICMNCIQELKKL